MNPHSNIPNDADGDVIRRLIKSNFNFKKKHTIDFNIDIKEWPPKNQLIQTLKLKSYQFKLYEPSDEFNGYIQIEISDFVSYDLVVSTQKELSKLAKPYGGICESLGVIQE